LRSRVHDRNLQPISSNFHSSTDADQLRSIDPMMRVQEMFFSVYVNDMERATTFYVNALGATVDFASPTWSSLVIAGMRVSLVLRAHEPSPIGVHFIVDDVALACAAVVGAGGQIAAAIETPHGAVIVDISDSEGNGFTLRQRPACGETDAVPVGGSARSVAQPASHAA
jgi:predicted enzyme related to lactoylglutathione lyase